MKPEHKGEPLVEAALEIGKRRNRAVTLRIVLVFLILAVCFGPLGFFMYQLLGRVDDVLAEVKVLTEENHALNSVTCTEVALHHRNRQEFVHHELAENQRDITVLITRIADAVGLEVKTPRVVVPDSVIIAVPEECAEAVRGTEDTEVSE